MQYGGNLPSAADFASRRVTNPDQSEIVRQRLYDYQLYAFAGQTQLSFFQQPIGQGLTTALGGTAGAGKTMWDTNMTLGGQLPSGMAYMVESIEVVFFPGSVQTANTYTPIAPNVFNATAAAAVNAQLSDVNLLYQSGLLEFNILQKNYLRETPLFAFPPKQQFSLDAALASNSATTALNSAVSMKIMGRPYYLEPTISLQPAVNWEVVIRWPAAVALAFNGRIGVILDGYTMRASQ
jgi:hypothetical protein